MRSVAIASLFAVMASVTVEALPVGVPSSEEHGVSRLFIRPVICLTKRSRR